MRGFIVRRLCGAFATFLVATMVVFTITFALPGDPARTIAGRRQVPQATIDAIRARYHLDDTLPSQYLHWLGRLLRGDLGESFASRRPVTSMLVDALPVSAALLAVTLLIEIVVGVGLGAVVGVRRGGTLDRLAVGFCTAGIAAPLFVTASVAQYLFGVRWRLLPVAGSHDGVRSYVLPALVLAGIGTAFAVRTMRAEVLEQAQAAHVRTAVGKGISRSQVTRRHVVRNSLTTVVTFFGLEVGTLIGGSVVVERVFNLAGVGGVIARSISQRDNVVILGFTMFVVTVYLVVDVVVDVVAMLLDPRLRSGVQT